MRLTPQESTAFWPVYNKYREEVTKVNDKLVKVITDYAAQRDTLTDAQANKLLTDYLAFEQNPLDLRKKYLKQFTAVLPMTKVARFYQIENKLDVAAADGHRERDSADEVVHVPDAHLASALIFSTAAFLAAWFSSSRR